MRRLKKITAFVLAFSLIIGFIPISYISRAAETENQYDETVLLQDDFSGDTWKNTASPEGYWRLNSTNNQNLAGVLDTVNQTAPLGYSTACRNLYEAKTGADSMTDVHMESTVFVNKKTYGYQTYPQLQFLTARCNVYGFTGIVFGFSTMPGANVSSLIVGTYSTNDNVTPFDGGQTEAIYNTEQEYHLELYVVGNLVIAKCDGVTVFEGNVPDMPASGYCGIIDRRATSNNASGTYGIDYVKGGYFDNFSIAKVNCFPTAKVVAGFDFVDEKVRVKAGETLDSVSVIPIYAEPYGTGKPTSEGVSVSGFNKNQVGMQKVTVTYERFSKEMIVSVYDDSVEYIIDENGFATEPFEQTEWKTAECYTNGYIEMSVALEEWTASQDATLRPMTLFYKPDNKDTGIYTRFQVTKNGDELTVGLQTYTYRPGESSAHFANGVTLSDFAWGKEYKIRLSVIGNYYEVRVNDEIKVQRTLNPNEDINKQFITGEAYFGFRNIAGISATVDQLTVVKYTPFEVQTTETVNVQKHADFTMGSIYNERISFLKNEQLEMTVEPSDGEQLSAIEGLVYYVGEDEEGPYPITDRLGEAGKNKDCCNTFVLTMPATKLRIADKYYTKGSADGNVGIIGVSIREKTGSKKYGIRFSSRAYMDYIDQSGKSYNLIEVGTLLFKERDEVSTEQRDACYASESKTLLDKYGNTIGKKVIATRAQDICDTYVDWGLILTYDDQTILFDVVYTTYSYAVYQAEDGTTVVKYGTNPKTYSYNQVAEKVGYAKQKASYLFYDVFSSGYREEWKFGKDSASTYDVQNGKLSIGYVEGSPSAVNGIVTGGEAWTDYAVSADVVFDSTTGISRGRSIGLTARNSGSYYYEFRLQYTESDSQMSAILYRFSKSGTEILKSLSQAKLKECLGESLTLGLDVQYNMRLEVRGSHIRCYVNGIRVIVLEDNSDNALTSGTAGLKSANNIATYEDFIVEAKEIQTIVGLQLSGPEATDNVVKLYEGFNIALPSYRLKVMDEDGTYQTVALTQEMISEYDNTILGEHEITLTYKGFSYPAKVLISERPDELEAFEKAITDAKAAVDSSSVTAKAETINNLKEQYDSFSPYELTKVKAQALETYEELQEALERVNDSNLTGYAKLLADSLSNVNEDTWNDSIMGNSAKWISINGTLYQAQTPYNMAVEGWHSPDVYGEIYSISADMTMLSENMNMGIAMNMSQTGCYYARVINTQENGETIYRVQLLKRTNTGYDHRSITYTAGYETLDLSLGQEFNLRMTLLNGVLTIYVDGVKVCTYDDSANNYQHTSGECGLRVLNGDGIYDNIRVYGKALEREDTGVADIKVQSYTDDFENETQGASPNLWQENYQATTVVDNWKVYQDGNTLVYGTQVTSGLTETWLHVFEKNPEFTAKFKVNSKSDDSEIGFITRRSPDTAFVNVGYDYKESKWYIASQESEAGGCEVFWAENTSELATEVWYTARLEASGKSVTLYINDNVVVSSDSVKHTGFGRLGFFTQNASMYVDDVDYTFKSGDIPQDGLLSYVMEPNKYSNYMEIESTDDGQTLVGVAGTTKKLSEDAGTTWKDITADSTWAGLKTGNYPTLLELHDGTYIQIVQNEKFTVYSSQDMKNWTNLDVQVVPEAEQNDSQGHSLAILHVNSATEVQFSDGSYRIFCPVAFRKYNESGIILGHYTKIYYSDDGGASWECSKTTTKEILPGYKDRDSTTWSESKIIKCSDGTLRMYYSRNHQGCMQYTVSRDKGETWEGMYQIPELQCAMTSFAIIEDPTARGTYYMLWINGEANYLGSMLPRVRPCLLRSTDGMNWEFLMNCEYMPEVHSTTNGEALYQILDPSLYVTEDYVYVTFGRSEREFEVNNANSHQAQRCYYLRVQKDTLQARPWDASTVANMKYPKTIEISTMPQTEFKYDATFSFATGVLKITALDGTVRYEPMTTNCAIYNKPNMTASNLIKDATETVILYYVNGYKLSYDITIKKRTLW